MADDNGNGEIDIHGPAGLGLRTKGYRLMDIAWVIVGAGVIWGAWEMKAHGGEATAQSAAVVKSINEASDRMVKALERVADEQRATNIQLRRIDSGQREQNCLQDPVMRNRSDAREVCKRLSGSAER